MKRAPNFWPGTDSGAVYARVSAEECAALRSFIARIDGGPAGGPQLQREALLALAASLVADQDIEPRHEGWVAVLRLLLEELPEGSHDQATAPEEAALLHLKGRMLDLQKRALRKKRRRRGTVWGEICERPDGQATFAEWQASLVAESAPRGVDVIVGLWSGSARGWRVEPELREDLDNAVLLALTDPAEYRRVYKPPRRYGPAKDSRARVEKVAFVERALIESGLPLRRGQWDGEVQRAGELDECETAFERAAAMWATVHRPGLPPRSFIDAWEAEGWVLDEPPAGAAEKPKGRPRNPR